MARHLGSALRLVRIFYDARQLGVARRGGVSQQLLSAIEHGERKPQVEQALPILEAIIAEEGSPVVEGVPT